MWTLIAVIELSSTHINTLQPFLNTHINPFSTLMSTLPPSLQALEGQQARSL
jgi:hypothetical protein